MKHNNRVKKKSDSPHPDELRQRVNRIEGQIAGIGKMLDEDRYCVDILMQIRAVRSGLNQVAALLLENHTKHCVKHAIESGSGDEHIEELIEVFKKYS